MLKLRPGITRWKIFLTPAGGSKRRAEQQANEDRLDEAMKGHRPWRLSSATLVRLLSEVYVEAALIHIGQNQSGVCALLYHRRVER